MRAYECVCTCESEGRIFEEVVVVLCVCVCHGIFAADAVARANKPKILEYIRVCVRMYIYVKKISVRWPSMVYTCTYVYIYVYVNIYIYIRIYIYTHI